MEMGMEEKKVVVFQNDDEWDQCLLLKLPLGEEAVESFDLEKAVCSHGLFMMAPNFWDPLSKALIRPLRLHPYPLLHDDDGGVVASSSSASVRVRISHPNPRHNPYLHLQVFRTLSLSSLHQQALLGQVQRMLRLSESDEMIVRAFQKMNGSGGGRGGRLFRSPTLFEDMVKCILLCNCQWPRTLTMARSLHMLQSELQKEGFIPNTLEAKELKKWKKQRTNNEPVNYICNSNHGIGNFPEPIELVRLDEDFLAKKCNLGYRAGRILKLAKSIVEGRVRIKELEEISRGEDGLKMKSSNYDILLNTLKQVDGFGPFTCANVLMCMGFYHVVPADSETIRHLKQVHGRKSSMRTIQKDVEDIYRKYAPFQFLAYWAEVWNWYEKRFGKLSEMPCSDYKLITASNMRTKANMTTTMS